MARLTALTAFSLRYPREEWLRLLIVWGSALTLIAAGRALPF